MDLLKEESKVILNCNRVLNFLYDKKGIEFFEINANEIGFKNFPERIGERGLLEWIDFTQSIVVPDVLRKLSTFDLVYMMHASVMVHKDWDNPERIYAYVKVLIGVKCIVPPKPHLMCQRLIDRFKYGDAIDNSTEVFGIARHLTSYEEIRDVWHNMLVNSATRSYKDHTFFIFNEANSEERYWWYPFIESLFSSLPPSSINKVLKDVYVNCDWKQSIEGLNFRSLPSKEAILINIVKIFMECRNLFVEDGWIYQLKADKSELRIIKLENLFEFSSALVVYLRHCFPHQINEEDLNMLMFESAENCLKKILAVPSLLPQRDKKHRKLLASISRFKENDFLDEPRGESDFVFYSV